MGREKALKCAARDFAILSAAAGDAEKAPYLIAVELASSKSSEDSVLHWKMTFLPPDDSVYGGVHPAKPAEKLVYVLNWVLHSERYPHEPPEIRLETPIFHPLVDEEDGKLCEGALSDDWKPSTPILETAQKVFHILFSLYEKEQEMPLNATAARLLAQGSDSKAFLAEVAKKKALIQ